MQGTAIGIVSGYELANLQASDHTRNLPRDNMELDGNLRVSGDPARNERDSATNGGT
jgi:hypothetical protein